MCKSPGPHATACSGAAILLCHVFRVMYLCVVPRCPMRNSCTGRTMGIVFWLKFAVPLQTGLLPLVNSGKVRSFSECFPFRFTIGMERVQFDCFITHSKSISRLSTTAFSMTNFRTPRPHPRFQRIHAGNSQPFARFHLSHFISDMECDTLVKVGP